MPQIWMSYLYFQKIGQFTESSGVSNTGKALLTQGVLEAKKGLFVIGWVRNKPG